MNLSDAHHALETLLDRLDRYEIIVALTKDKSHDDFGSVRTGDVGVGEGGYAGGVRVG
jgi:hypothetical protein